MSRVALAHVLALAFWAAGAIAIALNLAPRHVTTSFSAKSATHVAGYAYSIGMAEVLPSRFLGPFLEMEPDSNERPAASSLRLLEDGRSIGAAHALHVDIAEKGQGRFSHWGANLLFSSSDNSNPQANGRTYAVSYPIAPAAWIGPLLLLVGMIASLHLVSRSTRDVPLALAAMLFALALTASGLHCFPLQATRALPSGSIALQEGNRYAAEVAELLPGGLTAAIIGLEPDSSDAPRVSTLRLLEQGAVIGLPHRNHEEIARDGAGRYSHWGNHLLFSASDNSNPAANGRLYEVRYPVAPTRSLCLALLCAAALAVVFIARRAAPPVGRVRSFARALFERRVYLFWAGAGALWLYLNVVYSGLVTAPIPSPDSHGYLFWSLFRTPGYSLVLHTYHWVVGEWKYLGLYQLNLVIAGLFVLAWGLVCVTRSCAVGWIFLALALGLGNMLLSSADMLTEAAFTAFAMAHVGFVLLYLERGHRVLAFLAGAAIGMAILVKSVAVVLIAPLLLLIAFLPGRRRALAVLALAPAAFAWLAPSTYNLVRNGFFESSIAGGYALVGHVAWATKPHRGSPYEHEATLIERRLRPILAKRPPSFPSLSAYVDYTANEYNTLLWHNIVPEISQDHARRFPEEQGGACTWKRCRSKSSLRLTKTFMGISKETIFANPREYTFHVLAHHYGLWRDSLSHAVDFLTAANDRAEQLHGAYDPAVSIYRGVLGPPEIKTPEARMKIVARVESSPVKRALDLVTFPELAQWTSRAGARHPGYLVSMGLVASFLVLWIGRLPTAAVAFCYCGLCANAYFLGTALAQPSLVRYAWAMQGLVCALLVLGSFVALSLAARAAFRNSRPKAVPARA